MRVKVFSSESAEQLEYQINEFLKSVESGEFAEIRDIKYSVGATSVSDGRGQSDPLALFSALVFYREPLF